MHCTYINNIICYHNSVYKIRAKYCEHQCGQTYSENCISKKQVCKRHDACKSIVAKDMNVCIPTALRIHVQSTRELQKYRGVIRDWMR